MLKCLLPEFAISNNNDEKLTTYIKTNCIKGKKCLLPTCQISYHL